MNRRLTLAGVLATLLITAGCSTTGRTASDDPVAKRRSIDASVDHSLNELYAQAAGSRELVAKAKGVLVFPSVVSAGLVVGGSYGQGALRVRGASTGYYSTAAASVGLLAGAQSKAVFVLFMNQESLQKFQDSKGWTAGADASVAMVDLGATAEVTSKTIQQPIVGYAVTNGGLMANLSIDGTKVTRLDL